MHMKDGFLPLYMTYIFLHLQIKAIKSQGHGEKVVEKKKK